MEGEEPAVLEQPAPASPAVPAATPPEAPAVPAEQPGTPGTAEAPGAYRTNLLGDPPGTEPEAAGAAGEEGAPATPEAEAFEIAFPEGFEPDAEAVDFLKGMVRDDGMTRETAQKLADQHLAALRRYEAERFRRGNEQIRAWEEEIRAHPEYGGPRFGKSAETAKGILGRYASPKLVADFNAMGVLSHPEFMYMLMRMSRDVSDGASVGGAGAAAPEKSAAQVLYPDFK